MAYSPSYIMHFKHHKYKPIIYGLYIGLYIVLNAAMAESQQVQGPKVNMPTLLFHHVLEIGWCPLQQEAKHANTKDDKQPLRKARRAWEAVKQEPNGRHILWLPVTLQTILQL